MGHGDVGLACLSCGWHAILDCMLDAIQQRTSTAASSCHDEWPTLTCSTSTHTLPQPTLCAPSSCHADDWELQVATGEHLHTGSPCLCPFLSPVLCSFGGVGSTHPSCCSPSSCLSVQSELTWLCIGEGEEPSSLVPASTTPTPLIYTMLIHTHSRTLHPSPPLLLLAFCPR